MVKHLTDLLSTPTPPQQPTSYEDVVFDKLKDKFPLVVFSCVQLASKLFLHSHVSSVAAMCEDFFFTVIQSQMLFSR